MRKVWIAALLALLAGAAALASLRVDSSLILDCPTPEIVGVAQWERAAQDGTRPECQSIFFAVPASTSDSLRFTLLRYLRQRGGRGPVELSAAGEAGFDLGEKTVRLYVYADGNLYRVVLEEWAMLG